MPDLPVVDDQPKPLLLLAYYLENGDTKSVAMHPLPSDREGATRLLEVAYDVLMGMVRNA